ncbi:MAG: porin family protein [Chitinophagaceae bacterium]
MKKLILTTLVTINLLGSCIAQSKSNNKNDKNNLKLGFKVGANYSNVFDSKDQQFQADSKFGFVVGGFLSIPFAEFFAFQPEVLFSQKGFKGTGSILGSPYEFTRTTSFIDVPLLFAIKPSKYFTVLVGPQYSYLMTQRDEFTSSLTSGAQQQEFNNDNIRKNILSVLTGFDVTGKQIVFGARVGWDIQNNNGDGTSSTPRYKNVWYQATIGFVL